MSSTVGSKPWEMSAPGRRFTQLWIKFTQPRPRTGYTCGQGVDDAVDELRWGRGSRGEADYACVGEPFGPDAAGFVDDLGGLVDGEGGLGQV
jgi:hypothetical protein